MKFSGSLLFARQKRSQISILRLFSTGNLFECCNIPLAFQTTFPIDWKVESLDPLNPGSYLTSSVSSSRFPVSLTARAYSFHRSKSAPSQRSQTTLSYCRFSILTLKISIFQQRQNCNQLFLEIVTDSNRQSSIVCLLWSVVRRPWSLHQISTSIIFAFLDEPNVRLAIAPLIKSVSCKVGLMARKIFSALGP